MEGGKEVQEEPLSEKGEYVLCAAIHYLDGKTHEHQPKNIDTGFVICGWRHSSIIATVSSVVGIKTRRGHSVQGFITSTNRFLDRKEAAEVAYENGQIPKRKKRLYSEEIYP